MNTTRLSHKKKKPIKAPTEPDGKEKSPVTFRPTKRNRGLLNAAAAAAGVTVTDLLNALIENYARQEVDKQVSQHAAQLEAFRKNLEQSEPGH